MQLIVQELALVIAALDGLELSTAGGISDRDASSAEETCSEASCDLDASLNHDLVDDFWVGLHLEVSLLVDTHETRE